MSSPKEQTEGAAMESKTVALDLASYNDPTLDQYLMRLSVKDVIDLLREIDRERSRHSANAQKLYSLRGVILKKINSIDPEAGV